MFHNHFRKRAIATVNRIKELRRDRNLTLKQLSDKTGISISSLSAYEKKEGEKGYRSPKIDKWQQLADFFGVSVPYLQGALKKDFSDKEYKKTLNALGTLNENIPLKSKIPEEQKKLLFEIETFLKYLVNVGKRNDIPENLSDIKFINEYLKALWALTFSMLGDVEEGLELADYIDKHMVDFSSSDLKKIIPSELIGLPSDLNILSAKFYNKSVEAKKKLELAKKIVEEKHSK